jgi:ribosome-associated protein
VTTLEELRSEDRKRALALIVGADAFLGLPTWHRWREIFELAHLVVVARPGVAIDDRMTPELAREWTRRHCGDATDLSVKIAGAIIEARITAHPISASAIREALSRRGRTNAAGSRTNAAAVGPMPCADCFPLRFWPILNATASISLPRMRLNKIQKTVISALDDIKARDVTVLDVRKLTSLFDTMIIATAESPRQVKALARHVRDKLTEIRSPIIGVEGEETGEWVLVDAGDIVVHIMQPAMRAHYNLEELWAPPATKRRTKASDRAAA